RERLLTVAEAAKLLHLSVPGSSGAAWSRRAGLVAPSASPSASCRATSRPADGPGRADGGSGPHLARPRRWRSGQPRPADAGGQPIHPHIRTCVLLPSTIFFSESPPHARPRRSRL